MSQKALSSFLKWKACRNGWEVYVNRTLKLDFNFQDRYWNIFISEVVYHSGLESSLQIKNNAIELDIDISELFYVSTLSVDRWNYR